MNKFSRRRIHTLRVETRTTANYQIRLCKKRCHAWENQYLRINFDINSVRGTSLGPVDPPLFGSTAILRAMGTEYPVSPPYSLPNPYMRTTRQAIGHDYSRMIVLPNLSMYKVPVYPLGMHLVCCALWLRRQVRRPCDFTPWKRTMEMVRWSRVISIQQFSVAFFFFFFESQ